MKPLSILFALLALPLGAVSAHADVLVVNADGSGDFTEIAAAAEAASDGDILLVQSDFLFDGLLIDGKALTLVGDTNGAERVKLGFLGVSNLSAQQAFTVRGLELGPNPISTLLGSTLLVSGCQGTVLIEDCLVQSYAGSGGGLSGHGVPALRVADASGVLVSRSTLLGGDGETATGIDFPFGVPFAGPGAPAVRLENAVLSVFDSSLVGGEGGDNNFPLGPGERGGAAISGTNARVWIEGGSAVGGSGGSGCDSAKLGCGGGPGIALELDDPLFVRDAFVAGGSGGALTPGGLVGGGSGNDGVDLVGNIAQLPGGASVVDEASPVRAGEMGSLTVHGPEGATAAWFMSVGLSSQPLGGLKGVLAMQPPLLGPYLLGVLPASGQLGFEFTVPSLAGTGLEGLTLTKQAVVLDADGLRFSGPSLFVHVGDTP